MMTAIDYLPWNWFKHDISDKGKLHTVALKRDDELTKSNSYHPMAELHRDIDRVFDEAFNRFGMPSLRSRLFEPTTFGDKATTFCPNVNVSSNDDHYLVTVEAPGMGEDDLNIELQDDVLTIKGNKKEEKEEHDGHFYRTERRYGTFQRVLSLPKDAKYEAIKASMKNGVLTIHIPREPVDESQVKRIAISS